MRVENGNLNGVENRSSSIAIPSIGSHSQSRTGDTDDSSSDSVKLSGASSLVRLASNVHSNDRQSRIAQLASQVQSGSYQVNPQDVTQALLNNITL